MMKLFERMLQVMRGRGTTMGQNEFRTLWLIIAAIYGSIALLLIGVAVRMSMGRAWQRAIAEPPRRRSRPASSS